MALLSVANVAYSYGDRRVLDGVSLTLDAGQRVGIVGRNGEGKSTLMKIIIGAMKPDEGQAAIARGASVGYLTQDFKLDLDKTLREEAMSAFADLHGLHDRLEAVAEKMSAPGVDGDELEKLLEEYASIERRMEASGGYSVEHRVEEALHGVGLYDAFFDVKVSDLSGGQKGRLALAKLLLSAPDVLLLDEPTNHLDIAGRQWLEDYLVQYPGAVLMISHDRWMLDRVVSKILELERGELVEYPGNYVKYRELRAERLIALHRQYEKQQEKLRSEQAFIDRYRAGQRAKQAQGREKRLERYKRDEVMEKPVELNEVSIRFGPRQRTGDIVSEAERLTMEYETKVLFRDLSLSVKRGARIGIIGPNGAGKTTLTKVLLGELEPTGGTTKLGSNVDVGHYKQTHEGLPLDYTVVEYLRKFVPSETEQEARNLAGAFLFSGMDQDKRLSVLSGGERSRAVLAGLVAGGHNVLVLDEPTNHLDIPGAERLEAALREFTQAKTGYGSNRGEAGTLMVISHDRMLLDQIVDQLIIFDGHGHVEHFLGTYSEYLAATKGKPAAALVDHKAGAGGPSGGRAKPQAAGQGAKEGSAKPQAAKVAEKPKKSRLAHLSQAQLEARIVEAEKKLAELDTRLADPAVYRDAAAVKRIQGERGRAQAELAPLEEEWASRAE